MPPRTAPRRPRRRSPPRRTTTRRTPPPPPPRTTGPATPEARYRSGIAPNPCPRMHAFDLLLATALAGATTTAAAASTTIVDWPLPPTVSAAQPDLSVAPDGDLLLSWIEKTTDGHRLRFARHEGDDPATGWSPASTVAAGDDWFVNWADFPALQALPDGSLWAHALVRNGEATYAYDT